MTIEEGIIRQAVIDGETLPLAEEVGCSEKDLMDFADRLAEITKPNFGQ